MNATLSGPAATVLKDSVGPDGSRLTTFEIVLNRFVLAELNTHRVLSKNSASSRAIPSMKQIEMLRANPAYPLVWPAEQSGMQGGAPLSPDEEDLATRKWARLLGQSIDTALELRELGLHKSLTNRILEPYMWHRVVITGTAWENFFRQRDHADAQPEIAAVARLMHEAYESSQPTPLDEGMWHLPYVSDRDIEQAEKRHGLMDTRRMDLAHLLAMVSAARCARTSYLTNPKIDEAGNVLEEARVDIDKDISLYDRLVEAEPRHWSPLEHPATPWPENRQTLRVGFGVGPITYYPRVEHLPVTGNLLGWRTLRTEVETILDEVTYR